MRGLHFRPLTTTCVVLCLFVCGPLRSESLRLKDNQGREVVFPEGRASFADAVVEFRSAGPKPAARAADPAKALGAPDYRGESSGTFLSLSEGGALTLRFDDNVLIDVPGPDLYIFEVGSAVEAVSLEISSDGRTWVDVGRVEGGVASVDIHGYVEEGAQFRWVRLTDIPDPSKQPYPGADIDAVGAIGAAERVDLPAAVLFDVDSATLKPGASTALDAVVARIRTRAAATVVVEGHTDNTGADEHNLDLSIRRAEAVASYLAGQGIPRDRIDARGFGESRPAATNDTDAGRQANRRVEILIQTR